MVLGFRRLAIMGLATLALVAQIGAPLACQVPGTADITPFDGDRMTGFFASRSRALGEAMVADNAQDRAVVSTLFASGETPLSAMPNGAYRCRTIKLGGLLPLVTYPFFQCAVSAKGKVIEKLTGSQRFKGSLVAADGALFYQGALHYGNEAPFAYAADPERNQVGCLYQVAGPALRYRLELPSPLFESTHDVIELLPVP